MKTLTKSILTAAVLVTGATGAYAQTIADYSVLPETIGVAPDQTPNIMIILDTSGSMAYTQGTSQIANRSSSTLPKGGASPDSISYRVREAIRNVLTTNAVADGERSNLNVGLMVFGTSGLKSKQSVSVDDCKEYDGSVGTGCSTSVSNRNFRATRKLTGYGTILKNVEPLDASHRDVLNDLMATEPDYPYSSANRNNFGGNSTYFPDVGNIFDDGTYNILNNGIIVSGGGTPTRGSLRTAAEYFVSPGTLESNEVIDGLIINSPGVVSGVDADCRAKNYIFLITDGDPNGRPGEDSFANNNDRFTSETNLIESELKTLRDDYGIETLVFGYGLTTAQQARMEQMADGGSDEFDAFLPDTTEQLATDLQFALQNITTRGGSSSGISVVASSSDTAGSVVQAIYSPEITADLTRPTVPGDTSTNATEEVVIAWTSTLSAFFLDEFGYLREDNATQGTQGKLDGYDIDSAFTLQLEDVDTDGDGNIDTQDVRATRITPTNIGQPTFTEVEDETNIKLENLQPIWEASDVLGKHYDSAPDLTVRALRAKTYGEVNRGYDKVASDANGYRRVYTWIQTNPGSDAFGTGNLINFVYDSADSPAANTLNKNNYTLLDAGDQSDAEELVRWVRGQDEGLSLRNRSTDDKTYLLGDIVHSSAAQVDTPDGAFNTQFQDDSYTAFRDKYEFRRRMVYVGSNGGMLHAFNGGFWDGEAAEFNLKAPDGSDEVEHELGAEVWSYVPMNLLPHLKFIANKNYDSTYHVAFVDGAIQSFDVKAFTPDDTHVNGWGTIIVAGMRFGGGPYAGVDHDADGDAADEFTARSAYIIMDVTDPTEEPVVLGEITHPNLGFTTSTPDVMKEGDNWYLVFGSGPNDLQTATSVGPDALTARPPQIFRYLLNEGSRGFVADGDGDDTIGTESGFVGDIITHDWDSDYNDDAAYFGVIKGTKDDPDGGMYRYISAASSSTNNSQTKLLLDTEQAVVNRALLKRSSGKDWVFFGSGRFLTNDDAALTDQNTFYGVQEQVDYATVAKTSLVNTTNVNVDENGELSPTVAGQGTFQDLRSFILSDANTNGWFYNLPTAANQPANKTSAPALSFRTLLFFTDFEPPVEDDNLCTNEFGESFLNVVDLVTGTASFTADFEGPLGTDGSDDIISRVSIGEGYANQSYLFVGPDPETGKSRVIIKSPLSTGEIADTPIALPPQPNGRTSWREIEVQ